MRYPVLIFVHGDGFYAKCIRAGQRLRFPGRFAYWNHVAILINDQGDVVEALSQGVVLRNLKDWDAKRFYKPKSIPGLTQQDALEMLAFLGDEIGERYGWLTIASIGLHLLSAGTITLGLDGTEICSGLAARMLERGTGWFKNATDVMPADLAQHLGCER